MKRYFMPENKGDSYIAVCILITIFMNAFLAFVNNNVLSINQNVVVMVQLLITLFVIFIVVRTVNKNSILYFNKIVPLILLVVFSVAMKGELKYMELYGLFIIPLYVMLGVNFKGREYHFIDAILMLVFFVAIFEILFVDLYVDVFNPLNYYTSTRDWAAKVLENKGISSYEVADGDLYSGAYRPGGTISGFSHRVGSIFLEPLTLGYFGFFVFLFLYGLNSYRLKGMYLSAFICVFLAVISDTRIAVFMIFLTVFISVFSRFIPAFLLPLAPALIVLFVFFVYIFAGNYLTAELILRIGTTFEPFLNSNFYQVISGDLQVSTGVSAGDSGLIKIVSAAGALGAIYYYYLITGILSGFKLDKIHTVSFILFFVIVSLFGVLILSIKAAAAYAFFNGLMYGRLNSKR